MDGVQVSHDLVEDLVDYSNVNENTTINLRFKQSISSLKWWQNVDKFRLQLLKILIFLIIILITATVTGVIIRHSLWRDFHGIVQNELTLLIGQLKDFQGQHNVSLDQLKSAMATTNRRLYPCGGQISVEGTTKDHPKILKFQSGTLGTAQETCLWLIYSKGFGTVRVKVKRHDYVMKGQSSDSFSTLSLHTLPRVNGTIEPTHKIIQPQDIGKELDGEAYTILVFVAFGHEQGFSAEFYCDGNCTKTKESERVVNVMSIWGSSDPSIISTFAYPSGSTYSNFESRFVVVEPMAKKRINLSVDYIHLERDYDYLNIFSFRRENDNFALIWRFTDLLGVVRNVSFVGDEGQPFLLYLYSDGGTVGNGFEISYFYN